MQSSTRLGVLLAYDAVASARTDHGADGDTMDPALIEQKYSRKLDEIEMSAMLGCDGAEWQEKSPPTRSGNNRANECDRRRARNKAARKTRMQQRRRAKKG